MKHRTKNNHAFSLVELSIVLVILGLLTGGILAGQSLIRAAELRSVSAETSRYKAAIYSFRDKYFSLPGDMNNAVRFWGAQAGALTDGMDTTCRDLITAATGTATCNGDGDGTIAATTPETYESYRAWQHLANAGLIEGGFTGVTTGIANSWGPAIGTNSPASKFANAGYTIRLYPPQDAGSTSYFPGNYGNLLWFGAAATAYTSNPVLTPEEAWNLDTKNDDGKPAYGKIMVPENQTTCHTSTTPSISEYALTTSSATCTLLLLLE